MNPANVNAWGIFALAPKLSNGFGALHLDHYSVWQLIYSGGLKGEEARAEFGRVRALENELVKVMSEESQAKKEREEREREMKRH